MKIWDIIKEKDIETYKKLLKMAGKEYEGNNSTKQNK